MTVVCERKDVTGVCVWRHLYMCHDYTHDTNTYMRIWIKNSMSRCACAVTVQGYGLQASTLKACDVTLHTRACASLMGAPLLSILFHYRDQCSCALKLRRDELVDAACDVTQIQTDTQRAASNMYATWQNLILVTAFVIKPFVLNIRWAEEFLPEWALTDSENAWNPAKEHFQLFFLTATEGWGPCKWT